MDPGDMPTCRDATHEDWAACTAVASEHGRSFFLASRTLPPARRRAVLATYAFCRVADDIVDRARTNGREATETALRAWELEIADPVHPVAIAFAQARRQYNVPSGPVHDLVEGIRMDLEPARYATWDELRRYCHHVAGTVGLMVAPILGCSQPGALRHAAELGIAMQLTNILRDVAEDAGMGRLYLPLEDIERFGCDPEGILAGRPGGRFAALMAFEISRARGLYADALQGVPALAPSGRLATLAASRLYAGILDEIEAMGYDVFAGRAHLSQGHKARAMASVMVSFARTPGRTVPAPPRTESRPVRDTALPGTFPNHD